jgi:hypothetical protein
MLRKSFVPSVLLFSITALTAITSTAQAGEVSVKVPFVGNVVNACEFMGTPEPGTLTVNDSFSPTQLSSKNTGGSAGKITIKCNTDAKVVATGYDPTGTKKFDVAEAKYTLSTEKYEEAEAVAVSNGETPITVNLSLTSKDRIPAGSYAYNVIVSAYFGN